MFKKFKWSKWTDLATGLHGSQYYLLQAKRRADGKVKFRVASSNDCYFAGAITLEKLKGVKSPVA